MNEINVKEITKEKILFFDMDGTLIDTDFANFLAYQKAIYSIVELKYRIKFNPYKRLNSKSLREFVPNLTNEEYLKIVTAKENYFIEYLNETELREDILNVLLKYSKTNKTVLVTNSQRKRAIALLNYFGLFNQFDSIFCKDSRCKKNEVNKFQDAIQKLGIKPSSVVAFENEELEILLAIQVGIQIINPIMSAYNEKI